MELKYKKRLLKLAEFLRTVPRSKFRMGYWASGRNPNACGTSACACGWATTIPSFKRAGFKLIFNEYDYFEIMDVESGVKGFAAARSFFGLSDNDAYFLFNDAYYVNVATPKQVASRIEKFVREKLAEAKQEKQCQPSRS